MLAAWFTPKVLRTRNPRETSALHRQPTGSNFQEPQCSSKLNMPESTLWLGVVERSVERSPSDSHPSCLPGVGQQYL